MVLADAKVTCAWGVVKLMHDTADANLHSQGLQQH